MIPENRQPRLLGRTKSSDRIKSLQERSRTNRFGRSAGVIMRETAGGTVISVPRRPGGSGGGTGAVWL